MDSSKIRSSARKTGLEDRIRSEWCNNTTGELVKGVYIKPGMQVVDVGCGDGGYAHFCAKMGTHITFVDIEETKVRALEKRLKDKFPGEVKGIVSSCDPIPLPDGFADLVISTEVLEHVQDPVKFLKEIVRLGGPQATYVLSVPDARGENLVKTVAPSSYFQEPNHIRVFTSDDFEKLASDCGLEVIRHDYFWAFWSIFFLLKWAMGEPEEPLTENTHPATIAWTQTWDEVLKDPNGDKVLDALNEALPRSQMIVAKRKDVRQG